MLVRLAGSGDGGWRLTVRFTSYINRVTGTQQLDEPPEFYGGIVADPMGFGKTLSMIALAASDAHHPDSDNPSGFPGVLGEESNGLTLIVVPPARMNPPLMTRLHWQWLTWMQSWALGRKSSPSKCRPLA
jgi:hypothetical protein